MGAKARKEYLEEIRQQYIQSSRKERSSLLDEAHKNCGYNRKYLISLFNSGKPITNRKKKKAGRRKKYDHPQILEFLIRLLKRSNLVCSKRLVHMIPTWLPWYEETFRIELDAEVRKLLLSISAATIDRMLAKNRSQFTKRGLSTTKPGSLLKKHIPIKTQQWDERRAGYLEADTVAHCGSSAGGMFVLTLNMVDIATCWTEQRAVWGKGKVGVQQQIADIESSLPFRLRGFDADNGSEFINWHLMNFFTKRRQPVDFTRSREYKKNDNAHVEEKNYTLVRQYFGYERFDNPAIVQEMNELYKNEWRLLLNFFIPSFKLLSKERIGSKVVKKHSLPLTPYERVLASPDVSAKMKKELKALKASLNPFHLERIVSDSIKSIMKNARCGDSDCPYHT